MWNLYKEIVVSIQIVFVFLKYIFYMAFVLIIFKLKAEEYAGFLS